MSTGGDRAKQMISHASTLLIGLDGFDPDLTQQWMESGDLPHLKKIADNGLFAPLKSTIPPFTYPAWSSLITGVNPGEHGMIDFAVRKPGLPDSPGSYSVEFINSSFRKSPTIFKRLSDLGQKIIAMGFPSTYPPESINGIMISGFDSPLAVSADKSFCHPPELWDELVHKINPYTLAGVQELNTGGNWHRKAARQILATIEERTKIATYLIQEKPWNLFAMVFSESDTAAHHFWAAHDVNSPRHTQFTKLYDSELNGFLKTVYQTLDRSVGKLIASAENQIKSNNKDTSLNVMIVSDHGSGGTGINRLSINRVLEQLNVFKFKKNTGHSNQLIKPLARLLPAKCGQWLFRKGPSKLLTRLESSNRLKHAEIKDCVAFSDELNYFPSIWINDSRFPDGHNMNSSEREDICTVIIETLEKLTNPKSGQPVINRVYRREELYHGQAMDVIPDLILEPNLDSGYSYAIWNASEPGPPIEPLPTRELMGRKGGSMNGSHRQHGVLFLNQTSGWDMKSDPNIVDAGQYLQNLCGLTRRYSDLPVVPNQPGQATVDRTDDQPYTEKQAEELENRLRDLGYLD